MHRYTIKQIPGSQHVGIFVNGTVLATLEGRHMHREAELLVKLAHQAVTLEYMRPPAPIIFVTSEAEKDRVEERFVRPSEVRSDLNWDA